MVWSENIINTQNRPLCDYDFANSKNRAATDTVTYKTTQISKEKIADRTYAYTYGKRGNITKITEKVGSGTAKEKATYTYDALGQLKTENNVDLGQRIVYTYDAGGNISSKKIYAYTNGTVGSLIDTINYTYDTAWKDQLKKFDGQSIIYDEIGNPETYRDGMSFTWNGRQMQTANLNGTAVTYKYNADGLRTYKKVGSTVHEYEYSGGKLFYEKRGDLKFYYRYDAFGNLATITRLKANGDIFNGYVICNSRGDVEEIRRSTGELFARYVYDSWGNVIHIYDANGAEITSSTNIAVQNPIRYRGYYYDAESGLYYLQSRYYDPVTGRFLNADDQIAGTGGDVLGYNLYAYCQNNPVNMSDSEGEWPSWGKAAAVIAVAAAVVAAVAITVSTFGAGSVAGVAAISATITMTARATEVAALQIKKSKSTSNNAEVGINGNSVSNSENASGGLEGSSMQKSGGQVAIDVADALFDNGLQIAGVTPFTKTGSIGGKHIFNKQVSKIFGQNTTLSATLSATGGKVVPYAFAALAWYKTTISIFSDDPAQRAEQRGYTLK